jgi:lysyl-tRNA synthetase class II
LIGWIGKKLNQETNKRIDELKADSNQQIKDLRTDLDNFEKSTNETMTSIQKTSASNCKTVKREVEEIKKSNDMQTIRQIRAHVLDFANSCMNHRKHSKQDFENIIDENTLYETLVKKYRVKNKVYEEDYKFIMKIYHQCQDNNCFLRDPDVEQEETE